MPDRLEHERTYLDLAMREHLLMREEMSKNLAQTFALITGAFLVAGGLVAAVNVGELEPDQQAILLLLGGAFGFLVFIGALGQFNSFRILELYVRNSAEDMRKIAGADARGLLSFQRRVAAFNLNAFRPDEQGLAWLISYGAVFVVAGFTLILLGGIVALGGGVTWEFSHNLISLTGVLLLLDIALFAVTTVWLAFTVRNLKAWEKVFSAPRDRS